jgi:hypothetical protein
MTGILNCNPNWMKIGSKTLINEKALPEFNSSNAYLSVIHINLYNKRHLTQLCARQ